MIVSNKYHEIVYQLTMYRMKTFRSEQAQLGLVQLMFGIISPSVLENNKPVPVQSWILIKVLLAVLVVRIYKLANSYSIKPKTVQTKQMVWI